MPPAPRLNGPPTQTADVVSLCLKYLGIEPVLEPHYDRSQVRLLERVQSRIDRNNAPDHMVKRYAHQMGESDFPPPLYTDDGVPVDGNTRTKAYALRGTRYIQAYRLPIRWDEADPPTREKLVLLSLALNAKNGLPLDVAELLKFAERLIQANNSDEDVVGNTGLAPSKVAMLRAQIRARERLTNLGHNVAELTLPDTALRAFGKPNAMQLDDQNYVALLQLTCDANLGGNQVNALATSLKEQTSPEARQERLARERQALDLQIRAIRHGQLHPIMTDKLRKAIELLLNNPITSFVEGNLEQAAEYIELLDKAIERLSEIRTLQQTQAGAVAAAREATAVH